MPAAEILDASVGAHRDEMSLPETARTFYLSRRKVPGVLNSPAEFIAIRPIRRNSFSVRPTLLEQ